MSTADDKDEITRLRAQLREAELRLQEREHDWELLDRKRRHTERLFTAAFDEGPEAVALSRLRDGLIVDVSQEWLALTGYTRDEVIGHTVVEIGHWPDQATRDAAIADLQTRRRLRDLETRLNFPGRGLRLVRLNGSVIDVGGEPHVLMYVKDITAERQAEEAVRASELALERANEQLNAQLELYDLTESLARVGHWTASPDGKTITFSPGLQRLAGEVEGDASRPSPQARSGIHPDDLPAFLEARRSMDGRMLEYRWLHPDGSTRWLRSRMHRHHHRDGSVTDFAVVIDVTGEREASRALQDKLTFIENLTSHIPDVLFQYQLRPDGTSWFSFISASVKSMFRVSPEAAQRDARNIFSVIQAEDRARVFETMRAAHREGEPWASEFRLRHEDGTVRWVLGNAITRHESADGALVSYGSITDITERRLAQERLQESEARFRSLTDLSSDWYWEIDEKFRFSRFDGYRQGKAMVSMEENLGKTRWEIGALNMTPADWEAHRQVLAAHRPFRDLELLRLDAAGQPYWVAVSGTPIFDSEQQFRGYRGIGRDISTRKFAEDETQRLAFYDTLTGLPNRRLLMDRLAHARVTSARGNHHGALLFIDLDNFKDLNDTQGHDVGDMLLEQVAVRLSTCLREGDTAARFGGDEFVVMLEDLSGDEGEAARQTELVAEKILARLNAPYELVGRRHNSSPSIGITLFLGTAMSVDELVKRADVAMYQSKAAGRNTLRFFDPQMQAAVLARAVLDADLRQGLQRDQMLLHYHALVDGYNNIVGYEALLRWRHPERGLVAPVEFIGLAEQTGLILPIGQWVLRSACLQLVAWADQPATSKLSLAVNVSARQFRQNDFVAQVLAVLAETGANAQRLKLELTESVLISDVEDAIRKMGALRESGVRFALDDFGTGYSSLSYLKRLPLDQVKIDQSFVRDVLVDPNDAAIVRTILALARSLELQAVAEGVETEGQRRFLLDNGCTMFQGYLFGRPGPLGLTVLPA